MISTRTGARSALGAYAAAGVVGCAVLVLLLIAGRVRVAILAALHRDEAIAWTYASLPLHEIPDALRLDVNPPVYFVALHAWLSTGEDGEAYMRALSLLAIAVAAAFAFDATRRVGESRGGWLASAFVVLGPSTLAMAVVARPYALAFLVGMVALDAAVALVRGAGPGAVLALGAAGALLPITHYWGGLLLVAIMGGLAGTAARMGSRRLFAQLLLASGMAIVAVLPWLGTLVAQLGSTPLAAHVSPSPLVLLHTFADASGGPPVALALTLLGVIAVGVSLLRWGRGGRGLRLLPEDSALLFMVITNVITVLIIVAVWVVSQVRPLFSPYYAFLVLAPLPVLIGALLSRRPWTTLAPVLVGLVAVSVVDASRVGLTSTPENREVRGPEHAIAQALERTMSTDDVAFTSPGRVLAVRYYLGTDRQYLTPIGGVAGGQFDFRDRVERLRRTDPAQVADRLGERPPGTRIGFVHDQGKPLSGPYWIELDRVMDGVGRALARDPRFEKVSSSQIPSPYNHIHVRIYEVRDEAG